MPVLGQSHSKKAFPDVQTEPPVFQFMPIASSPVTGHCWKEPGSGCVPSLQVFVYIEKTTSPKLSSSLC